MDQIRFGCLHRHLQRQVELQVDVCQGNKLLLPAQRFLLFNVLSCFYLADLTADRTGCGQKKPTADRSAVGFL